MMNQNRKDHLERAGVSYQASAILQEESTAELVAEVVGFVASVAVVAICVLAYCLFW